MTKLILDTGPLVASLVGGDPKHERIMDLLNTVVTPLHTCEAVVIEACFLMRKYRDGQDAILSLISRGVLRCDFRLSVEIEPVKSLMRKFADVPMSLADACLVRMTELDPKATVLTFDSDFRVYRRHKRQLVPTLMP